MTKYYIDSCIWLNFLNKERTLVQGLPVWKIAELFLRQYQGNLIISNKVIRELSDKVSKEQLQIIAKYTGVVQITTEEYSFAQEIESKEEYAISFFDCIHLAICTQRHFILITRDNELITIGNKYVLTVKPEQFIY